MTQTYDAIGQRLSLNDPTGITTYTYDPDSRLSTQTSPNGMRLTYAYDSIGQRKSLTEPEGGRFSYTYDPAGRISKLVNPQNQITTFLYDSASRRTATILANGTRASYSYDSANHQLSVANIGPGSTTLSSFNYTYDPVGNRQRVVEASGNRVTWKYDKTYQLTNEQRSGSNSYNITYTYDPVGNRLAKIAGGVPTTNTYDAANELITSQSSNGTTTNTWDANGNLLITSAPSNQLTTYTWDFENRMTQAALPSGIIDTFEYDGDGKRVQKVDSSGTTNFIWDHDDLFLEYGSDGLIQVIYTLKYGFYSNLCSMLRSGITSFLLFNGTNSTVQLTDSSAAITDTFLYDSFGNTILRTGITIDPFTYFGKIGFYRDNDLSDLYFRTQYFSSRHARFKNRIDHIDENIADCYILSENNPFIYFNQNEDSSDPILSISPVQPCVRKGPCGGSLFTVKFNVANPKIGSIIQHVTMTWNIISCETGAPLKGLGTGTYEYYEAWKVNDKGSVLPDVFESKRNPFDDAFLICGFNNTCGYFCIEAKVWYFRGYKIINCNSHEAETTGWKDCWFRTPTIKRFKPCDPKKAYPTPAGNLWIKIIQPENTNLNNKPPSVWPRVTPNNFLNHSMKREWNCCNCGGSIDKPNSQCPNKDTLTCDPM